MIRAILSQVRRFCRREDGTATVEFSLLFLPMFTFLATATEVGRVHVNYAMLERAVDMTVRDIRLGTGSAPQHDDIRQSICERADFIRDCGDLKIEMVRLDPYNWQNPPTDVDCADRSEPVRPARSFVNGASNELMFLRACAKFDPVFPTLGMGESMHKDGAGMYALIATSAFVQEPR